MPKRGRSPKAARKPILSVPDAEGLNQFVVNAKRVWREAHPGVSRPRGRPSEIVRVFQECEDAVRDGSLKGRLTQGRVFKVIRLRLPGQYPHDDTILKYVRWWKAIRGTTQYRALLNAAMAGHRVKFRRGRKLFDLLKIFDRVEGDPRWEILFKKGKWPLTLK